MNKGFCAIIAFLWVGFIFFVFQNHGFTFRDARNLKKDILCETNKNTMQGCVRNKDIKIINKKQAEVIMLGDSITRQGDWRSLFPGKSIRGMGFDGATTGDVLEMLDNIITSSSPKKVFIMLGVNDVNAGIPAEIAYKNYVNIIEYLRRKGITVYIQSTLSCNKRKCGDRAQKIIDFNKRLKEYALNHKIQYIDINRNVSSGKEGLLPQYTNDGVHLLEKAYLIWRDSIKKYLK